MKREMETLLPEIEAIGHPEWWTYEVLREQQPHDRDRGSESDRLGPPAVLPLTPSSGGVDPEPRMGQALLKGLAPRFVIHDPQRGSVRPMSVAAFHPGNATMRGLLGLLRGL